MPVSLASEGTPAAKSRPPLNPGSSHSTPPKKNPVEAANINLSKISHVGLRKRAQHTMYNYWVGPMPSKDFMERCATASQAPTCTLPLDLFDNFRVDEQGKPLGDEKAIQEKFAEICNPVLPNVKIISHKERKDSNSVRDGHYTSVDSGIYDSNDPIINGSLNLSTLRVALEIKSSESYDLINDDVKYIDNYDKFMRPTQLSIEARGQVITYAQEIFNQQHRTHVFVISLHRTFARILRFERVGVCVTERISFGADGAQLVRFLWNLAHMLPGELGYDTTVSLASEKQAALVKNPEVLGKYFVDSTLERPVYKVKVPLDNDKKGDDGKHRYVLIWLPYAESKSIAGRGTRGWPAAILESEDDITITGVGFLKDVWREKSLEPEYAILKLLNDAKIQYVPTLIGGGLVDQQETTLQALANKPWRVKADGASESYVEPISTRVHQRQLTKEIGEPLQVFELPKNLLIFVRHAFLAHRDAYTHLKILHRDVSGTNILIVCGSDGKRYGILNDWDLARKIDDSTGPRQGERTGTWYFMSGILLRTPTKSHDLQDDLESFFHVVLYFTLRYLPHDMVEGLPKLMGDLFEGHSYTSNGQVIGGEFKMVLFTAPGTVLYKAGGRFQFTENPALSQWLFKSLRGFKQWYDAKNVDNWFDDSHGSQMKDEDFTLFSHANWLGIWDEALTDTAIWSTTKPVDQLPRAPRERIFSQTTLSMSGRSSQLALSRSSRLAISIDSGSSKRQIENDDDDDLEDGPKSKKVKKSA